MFDELKSITDVYPASEAYKYDETPKTISPKAVDDFVVVKPKSPEEVAEVLRFASENRIPVFVRGGGTGLSAGVVPTQSGIVLSTERLKKLEIDFENRIAICEAGVTLKQLIEKVEKLNLDFPIHVAETATIGGMVATNAGGIKALRYGTMRNFVLGLEVALPNGKILEFGSKTYKNSSGYQLQSLVVGSEGTLCVITKAYLKLIPKTDEIFIAIPFRDFYKAISSVVKILGLGVFPSAIEFMELEAVKIGEVVSGKRWVCDEGEAHLLIIVDRFEDAEKIAKVVEGNAIDVFIATSRREKRNLIEIRKSIYEGLRRDIIEILDICIPPAYIPEYVYKSKRIAEKYGIKLITYGHAGDGNIHQHPLVFENWQDIYFEFRKELFRLAKSFSGVLSGEHGIGCIKVNEFKRFVSRENLEIMRKLKCVFDPNGILNPGRVI